MSVKRLCLGTAKLGMPWYGAGSVSRPDHAESARILRAARDLGIDHFDTGRAYGDAEDLLLAWADPDAVIITKTAPDLWDAVMTQETWEPLLLHNPTVEEIELYPDADGASVYTVEEARCCIAAFRPLARDGHPPAYGHLQVPYCVADQRHASVIEEAKAKGLTVYARQPFLQGVLTNPVYRPEVWGRGGHWRSVCAAHQVAPLAAALWFALESPADFVVFGCGSETHLREVVEKAEAFPGSLPSSWPELYRDLRREFADSRVSLSSLWSHS